MPLLIFLQSYRKKVANTSRFNLLQSTEIVRCSRIIIREVYSPEFVEDENFGLVQSVLIEVEEALKAASMPMKQSDACKAFEQATSSILKASQILQLDHLLGDIKERMDNAKIKDGHAEDQKSLRLQKHLKRLVCSSTDKSPRIDIDIRVREHISDERKQQIINVQGKGTDTLDIVLLSMKLDKSHKMRADLHFYDRSLPGDITDLVTQKKDCLKPLPFDSVLSEMLRPSKPSKSLVLYCLYDHESSYIALRYQSLRSFTNLWEITLNAYLLKDTFGFIEYAEGLDVSRAKVTITKRQVPSGPVGEKRQGVWPELLREVHKSFGTASNICWTIEAPDSPRMPKPKPWLPESSSTRASTTPTLIVPPLPSVAYVAKKGKPGRSSWFTALVAKFND
ncbi:hypothetical protein EV421DRAFT_2042998 [Armillaria borealis]|uniref:Uncharacterized protein n=1 Tax=Armillaria borealis TaxID=47425 RepID=A0AA39ICG3_9AGAR|nr:hypothetical protein EV421DRAFT_2042998 [Armillaria borealis]